MSFFHKGNDKLRDTRIGDFRIVHVTTVRSDGLIHIAEYVVHKDEVDKIVEAQKRLHYSPGINPHNGNKTAEALSIDVCEFTATGPFWWSTPDLQNNKDSAGAIVMARDYVRVNVWSKDKEEAKRRADLDELMDD